MLRICSRILLIVGVILSCVASEYKLVSPQIVPLPDEIHPAPPHPSLVERWREEEEPILMNLAARHTHGIDNLQRPTSPPTGVFNLLVVPVDFSDNASAVPPAFFDGLIFNGPAPTGPGTVHDYFLEVSYGAFQLTAVDLPGTLGWQRALSTYNGPSGYINADGTANTADDWGFGSYPQNLQGIVNDILPILDPLIDFSQYDNDGDGFVESIVFTHAGVGAEITGNPNDIWASAWNLTDNGGPGPYLSQDGVWIDNFAFGPEFMVAAGDQTIGIYCHELGHSLFGLPDLYDYDLTSNGIGNWSVMSYGSWNGATGWGESPAWPDAWSRLVMGFDFPVIMDANSGTPWPFLPVETTGPGVGIIKFQPPQLGPDEYFLVEYRDTTVSLPTSNFDTYLPGSGLLIWHVDESKWSFSQLNTYECTTTPCCSGGCAVQHPLLALEQADANLDLENATNFGDAGDPFPGTSNNTAFQYGTTPESGSYYASPCPSDSCVFLNSISFIGGPGLIQANIGSVCTVATSCLDVIPDEPFIWGSPGSQISSRITVQNCSNVVDFPVTLSAQSNWPTTFFDLSTGLPIAPPVASSMTPGGNWRVGLYVDVPSSVSWNASDVLTITAQSANNPQYTQTGLLTAQVPYCLLLVDDDQGQPDVQNTYMDALTNGSYDFDYWDTTVLGSPDQVTLDSHRGIVWFTGSSSIYTLHPREEAALEAYLDNGGRLFFSSTDYLSEVGRSYFNRKYLGMGTYALDVSTGSVTGVTGNPVGHGLGPYTFTTPASLADQIGAFLLGSDAFMDAGGQTNGLTFASGPWKTLFLSWPVENLSQPDADELAAAALDWLDVPPHPFVDFTPSTFEATVGETITFTSQISDATQVFWDFGDGFSSTSISPTHVYAAPITATVVLTVSNPCAMASQSRQIIIRDVPSEPTPTFTLEPTSTSTFTPEPTESTPEPTPTTPTPERKIHLPLVFRDTDSFSILRMLLKLLDSH